MLFFITMQASFSAAPSLAILEERSLALVTVGASMFFH